MSHQKDKPATRLQVHPRVTPVSDVNDIVSHFGANPNLSVDMPNDGECLNIPQDRMTHDIRRDSIRYDSMQQIFDESGENIIWTWPIFNTTTVHMKGAQDYRSSRRDRANNTTTDDGELTNSYPENNPDGDVVTEQIIGNYWIVWNMLIIFWDGILGIHRTVGECQWYHSMYCYMVCYVVFTYVTEYRILVYVCRQEAFSL